ncbi:MAG TPA: hypothetical protein VM030_04755 [Acidimicrobiales bacterium]|nr:hypothetical protein [Acidimicrobiales bacterium]
MRRATVLFAVCLLFLAGCGKDKADDAVKAGATSSTSETTGTTLAGETVTTTGGDATGVAAGTATTAKGATAATTKGGTSGGGGAVTPGARLDPAKPGTYTYTVTGKRSSPAFGEQPMNGDSQLKVDGASGRDQHSLESSGQGSTEQVARYGDDGVRLVSLRTSQAGFTKEFKPASPVQILPWPVKDGQTWSWKITSTDGATTVTSSFTLVGHETLTIGTEKVDTLVIDATVQTSGDITSTSTQKIWASPAYRLVVQDQGTTDGSFGGTKFHSEISRKLKSTKPA